MWKYCSISPTVLIDSKQLIKLLADIKQEILTTMGRSSNASQKELLSLQMRTVEKLLISIHQMAQKGEMNMEKLKFLMLEEMEDATGMRESVETEEFIKELVAVGKMLPAGKRVPLNIESMAPDTFYNKVWMLKKAGKIPDDLVPSKVKGRVYLVRTTKKKTGEN